MQSGGQAAEQSSYSPTELFGKNFLQSFADQTFDSKAGSVIDLRRNYFQNDFNLFLIISLRRMFVSFNAHHLCVSCSGILASLYFVVRARTIKRTEEWTETFETRLILFH